MQVALLRSAALALFLSCSVVMAFDARRPLTVKDAIETTRALTDRNDNAIVVSPNGKRYAVMLIRGDVARDGVWAELMVGGLDSLDAARPRLVRRLFTRGLGGGYVRQSGSETLFDPTRNALRWMDDERLALLWEDARTIRQVVGVHAESGAVEYLTHHATDVVHFSTHASGALIYGAHVPCSPRPNENDYRNGFVVEAVDAFELLRGCPAWTRQTNSLWVSTGAHPEPRRIDVTGGDDVNRSLPVWSGAFFNPDGKRAVFATTVAQPRADWSVYTDDQFQSLLKSSADRSITTRIRQLIVIDVEGASARPVWEAPQEPYFRMRAAWSEDGEQLLLGPTYLPPGTLDDGGKVGEAVAVVHVRTGAVQRVPVSRDEAVGIRTLSWCGPDCAAVEIQGRAVRFTRADSTWRPSPPFEGVDPPSSEAAVIVQLRQGLNDPPKIHATHRRSGRSRTVLDLNPGLQRRFALGHVESIEHPESQGARWEGRLYYPINYRPDERYPLVLQAAGFPRDQYTIYGSAAGAGPGFSVYAAQTLAGLGMFVLQGSLRGLAPGTLEPHDARLRMEANERRIEELASTGKIDRARVGLMGFSANGWHASFALTHSSFPYAAAITDDNKDGGYLQAAHASWDYGATEDLIGARPFADGLHAWLEHSPALNAHRIRTPLLMTTTTPGTGLSAWEMFSRLRFLKKPAELYFIPDIERGNHRLQNPRQLIALQERAVDWWRFWLKDEEDANPAKAEQYRRWRDLRVLHVEAQKKERNASAASPATGAPRSPY